MNSSIISVSELLGSAKELASAGFSSGYNFDKPQASDFFDELILNKDSSPIFSGIIILEKTDDKYIIVDGLQRLTTISLLLCALCDSYKGTSTNNDGAKDKILERYLLNPDKNNEPKLKLYNSENEIYLKLINSVELADEEKGNNLFQAYITFLKKINEHKISGTDLFKIISKMQFMTVLTEKSEISVRDLYQALNDNKSMSQINLVSDFVSQNAKEAEETWQQLVSVFEGTRYSLESFISDFLITRMDADIPNKLALYKNFKLYYDKISKYQDARTIFENMYKYSKYYIRIINADFEDPDVKEQISILNESGGKDVYPYLMEVLDDLENNHLNTAALLNILMMINLFIKSQQETSFSNININFVKLSKELNKMLVLKDYVPDVIEEDKLTINVINKLSNFEV